MSKLEPKYQLAKRRIQEALQVLEQEKENLLNDDEARDSEDWYDNVEESLQTIGDSFDEFFESKEGEEEESGTED